MLGWLCFRSQTSATHLTSSAAPRLARYPWPENVAIAGSIWAKMRSLKFLPGNRFCKDIKFLLHFVNTRIASHKNLPPLLNTKFKAPIVLLLPKRHSAVNPTISISNQKLLLMRTWL
jgi:hypothetical protein